MKCRHLFIKKSSLKTRGFFPKTAFTLVEVLLGMTIVALMGLVVANVFWTSMKLDDKLRLMHDNSMEVLIADQSLTRDLENAISLDYSNQSSDLKVFDGRKDAMEFLTVTPKGIKRVRYYSGLLDFGTVTKTIIGKKIRRLTKEAWTKDSLPIEFLLRQESSLSDWVTQEKPIDPPEVIAAGLTKDTFTCTYAAAPQDMNNQNPSKIEYKDRWDEEGLPLAVSCRFNMYDPKNPKSVSVIKRDIFLSPRRSN